MKHVVVLLQFGSEVRQFSHSGFVDLVLKAGHRVTIAARETGDDLRSQFSPDVRWARLPRPEPSFAYEQIAAALDKAQAERRTKAGRSTWAYGRKPPANLRQRVRRAAVGSIGSWLAHPLAYRMAEALELRITRDQGMRTYAAWIDDLRPNAIVVNSPRANYQAHVLLTAEARNIARLLFFHTNKDIVASGRLDHRYTAVGVWNAWMKERLLEANPGQNASAIHVTGCGHFDPLARDGSSRRPESFRDRLGLAPHERIVLYTAAGPGVVPAEERHIKKVQEILERLGDHRLRLVVRLNPMDTAGAITRALETDRQRVVVLTPDWHFDSRSNICYQRREDGAMLAWLLKEAAVCVNIPSTITVECALAGVPVVNIGYDLPGPAPLPGSVRAFWDVDYYANVREAGAALLARDPDELGEHLRASLLDRDRLGAQQQRLVDLELGGVRPPEASRRYLAILEGALAS